ncbi:MAG TPA: hypothetical protein VMT34_07985 [Aggregatilineales bacterium]|nr:hypothetical protein [Aggregatilineales bacterium]
MNFEVIAGPLSRVICCLVPLAWLPLLLVLYGVRRRRPRNTTRDGK